MARRSDKNHSLILHVETSAQDNESHYPNDHNVSIESFNNTNNSTISLSTPLYSESYKPVYTQKTVVGSNSNMYTMQTVGPSNNDGTEDKDQISNEVEMIVDEHDEVPTEIENDELIAACDFEIDERNTSFEYTDDDLNEVLLSSTPVPESDSVDTDDILSIPEENLNICAENHYMPMTQKKPSESSTVPLDILTSIKKSGEVTEESAYIEMIKGSEYQNDCKSTYEFINISSSSKKPKLHPQLEPLYMELSHNVKRNSMLKNILDLPDILKEPMISNSTSSLNRLLTVEKNIKRFSLSDTFRPASYYLSTVKESKNESSHKTIEENNIFTMPSRERRQKNLSFDIKSSITAFTEENKNLNVTQSVSQLSLPEHLSQHYEKVKENTLKANSTNLEQSKMLHDSRVSLSFVEPPLTHSISSETTNSSFDESKQIGDLSFFDVTYIKPPDGFTNSSNEALDMERNDLCSKLSNTQLDCYYDSLEDVNQANESINENLEKDLNIPSTSINESEAACKFTLTTNHQEFCEEGSANISDTAPYYYSDIAHSSKTNENVKLNNLKDVNVHRAGITHIHNIIYNKIQHNDVNNELKDANDKMNGVNIKNLYESDHKLQKNIDKETERMLFSKSSTKNKNQNISEANVSGDQLWEEDSLWCERLRVQSHRHTKSLDELNRVEEETHEKRTSDKKTNSKLTRDVTYVNYEILPMKQKHMDRKSNQHCNDETEVYSDEADDVYVQLAITEDLYETLREEETQKRLYSIDREKIRQWDLMSSGLHLASSFGNLQKTDYIEKKENKSQ